MYLEVNGRKLALKKPSSKAMPKRNCSDLAIRLDGAAYTAKVTDNAAWSADPKKTLWYIWVEVRGVAYYVTLNYAEKAVTLKDAEFFVKDGVGDPVPKRVTAEKKREADRVRLFKETWDSRYGANAPKVEEKAPEPAPETPKVEV